MAMQLIISLLKPRIATTPKILTAAAWTGALSIALLACVFWWVALYEATLRVIGSFS